jgi:ribosomal protein S18 acetylase RimI-like enzyme
MPTDNYLLRAPQESDLPVIVDFEIEIARISFPDDAILDPAVHRKKLEKALERDRDGMFVAQNRETGAIEGWLWVALNTNFLTGEHYATFRSLATKHGADHPESATVADLLFAHGIDYAEQKGIREITGKVHVDNTAMRLVYRKFGFQAEHLTMKRVERSDASK